MGKMVIIKKGCPIAISIIATLFDEDQHKTNYIQTIAAIAASNGREIIRSLIR